MANDLLIAAIRESALDLNEIAATAGVDPRTVQRWLGGRVPHPRYRLKLAGALGVEEAELWPESGQPRRRDQLEEIAGAYARRNDPEAPDWRALVREANHHIDLLGYSLLYIAEARGINKALTARAHAGCQIRIALADSTAEPAITADLHQRPPGRLISRIKTARSRLLPLAAQAGIELREHQIATSHTILRFDDHILLTIHLYGTPGFQSPLLHFRRAHDYGLFDQLAKHVEDVWQQTQPIEEAELSTGSREPQPPRAPDSVLDDLDYVWRPSR